jgi:hypothetical protein
VGVLTATLDSFGDLVAGRTGYVGVTVTNTGTAEVPGVTALVELPPGVTLSALPESPGSHGASWDCTAVTTGASCTLPALPPGTSTSLQLRVVAAAESTGDTPLRVTVSGTGVTPVVVRGSRGVQRSGMSAVFAARGPLRVTEVGNALQTCPVAVASCAAALKNSGSLVANNDYTMVWNDTDADPSTTASSAAQLTVPAGASVVWAGLYWSSSWDGKTDPSVIRLRAPGATDYRRITADRVDTSAIDMGAHPNFPAYQGFADVTELVQKGGPGTWWAADPVGVASTGSYAGWALVVVLDDPSAPDGLATVFDGLAKIGGGSASESFPVSGQASGPALIGAVAWEGDATISGDTLSLNGTRLTPNNGLRDPNNVFDSSANGAVGPPLTFGTDVTSFFATYPAEPAVLTAATTSDQYLLGVLTVSGG